MDDAFARPPLPCAPRPVRRCSSAYPFALLPGALRRNNTLESLYVNYTVLGRPTRLTLSRLNPVHTPKNSLFTDARLYTAVTGMGLR